MKAFLDTSVLVPVFYRPHVHHAESIRLFLQSGRITGDQAMLLISEIRERLTVVALDVDEYVRALAKSAALCSQNAR